MLTKNIRLISLLLILFIIISLLIGAKSCLGRSRNKTKVGSSIPPFMINAPSGLAAVAVSSSQIDLFWQDNSNPPAGEAGNEDGFEIERSVNSNNDYSLIATVSANTTSYSDSGLIPSTSYYYRVRAFNNDPGDRSDWSNEVRITTLSVFQQGIWSQVAAGGYHSLALRTDGTVWSWGGNVFGQLGLGGTTNRIIPSLIESDIDWETFNNISALRCGDMFSIALKTDGTLWAWGANGSGQLGQGDDFSSDWPTPVGTDSDWLAVGTGSFHAVGLKSDGSLWAWGFNTNGELGLGDTINKTTPTRVTTETNWSMIACGGLHTMALKNDRTLWAWGYNGYGELGLEGAIQRTTPTLVTTESDWSIIAGGYLYSLAIKTTGTLWAWGRNDYGQLGLNDSGAGTERNIPTKIGSDTDWIAVNVAETLDPLGKGGAHTLGLKSNGTLWAWGRNEYGQLGVGDSGVGTDRSIPTLVTTESDWLAVTAGSEHTIGLKTNKTIWSWGWNYFGELGLGDTIDRNIPCIIGIPLAPSSLIATVISSSQIDLSWTDNFIGEDGFAIERKTWAGGTWAQIFTVEANITSYSNTFAFSPGTYYYYRVMAYNNLGNSPYSNVVCAALSGNWLTLTAGSSFTLGLKTNKTLWAWGLNNYGQLGLDDIIQRTTPTPVTTETDWLTVAAGNDHTLGLKTNKTLWAWGYNNYGQLGLEDTISRTTPTLVTTETDWIALAPGNGHTLGLKTNKKLWAWGLNTNGQLGLNDIISRTTPTLVTTETDWSIIAAGFTYSFAIKTTGTLWTWGYNGDGQLGLGGTISRTTPTLVTTEIDWSIIAAGSNHSLAIKTTGTLWAWGNNQQGQLGIATWDEVEEYWVTENKEIPTQVTTEIDWSIITAGSKVVGTVGQRSHYSLALKTNGTLWAWGRNNAGQLGLGDTDYRYIPTRVMTESDWSIIAAGRGSIHSLAIKTTGTLWAWGINTNGQLGLGDLINRNIPTIVGE